MQCDFKCGSSPIDKATCQCYNDYMAEAERSFFSQNNGNTLVSGSLPPDRDKIWEELTRNVCGRDMSGLEPYYKNDLIDGVISILKMFGGNDR